MKTLNIVLLLIIGLASACTTVPIKNFRECTVAGVVQAGMDCAETNTGEISTMTYSEMLEWLEPQPERPNPDNPEEMLPARAGAVCRSDDDFTAQKTALEQVCALLGDKCRPEIKQAIKRAQINTLALTQNAQAKKKDTGVDLEFHRLEMAPLEAPPESNQALPYSLENEGPI